MNVFEQALCQTIGEDKFAKIQSVKVGIAGCGGLGSNCAFNLVRSGFKNLKIIDFDKVDASNLNRQFFFVDQVGEKKSRALKENLKRINSNVDIEAIDLRIEKDNIEELFLDCEIIVEAFDKPEYKKLFAETFLHSDKLAVSASGIAGAGQSDNLKIRYLKDKFVVVGDMESGSEDNILFSPRVNIAAAKQADVILDYVLNA